VCEFAATGEPFVTGEDDLGHDIAVLAVVFEIGFGAQVIEADKVDGFSWDKGVSSVALDDIETVFVKFEGNVATGFDDVVFVSGRERLEQRHQGSFATTYRAGQKNSFFQVNAFLTSCRLIAQRPGNEPADYGDVFFTQEEKFAVGFLAALFQLVEGFLVKGSDVVKG